MTYFIIPIALERFDEINMQRQWIKARKTERKICDRSSAQSAVLMVELFKTKNNLNPKFMKNVFTERDAQYNLRNKNHLQLPNVMTAEYGIDNIQ